MATFCDLRKENEKPRAEQMYNRAEQAVSNQNPNANVNKTKTLNVY